MVIPGAPALRAPPPPPPAEAPAPDGGRGGGCDAFDRGDGRGDGRGEVGRRGGGCEVFGGGEAFGGCGGGGGAAACAFGGGAAAFGVAFGVAPAAGLGEGAGGAVDLLPRNVRKKAPGLTFGIPAKGEPPASGLGPALGLCGLGLCGRIGSRMGAASPTLAGRARGEGTPPCLASFGLGDSEGFSASGSAASDGSGVWGNRDR